LRHSENLGLAAARNTGFHHSNTEYVLFLDSDDRLAIDAIEKLLLAMKSCSKKAFAFSNIQLEGERKAEISSKYLPFTQRFINKIPYCILLRKSDLASTTIYREEFRCGLEDWELNVRLISLGFTPVHVDEPLFYYSVSSNGMLRLRTIRLFAQILKQIIASNKDFYRPRYLFHDFLHQIRQQGFHSVFASLLVLLGLIFLPSKLFNLLLRLWLDKTQD
jgi:glycosyltransferase involved in cell wall biosynthesis